MPQPIISPLYKRVFQWVSGTHIGLLLFALVLSLVSCEEEIKAVQSASLPPPPPEPLAVNQRDPSERIQKPLDLDLSTLILMPEEALKASRPRPKPPEPKPEPPKPEPEPEPKPEPKPPEPEPEPEPEPKPEPARISYEEFVKKFGRPEPTSRPPRPRPAEPVPVPDIRVDSSAFDNLLAASDRSLAAGMSAAEQRVLMTYGEALVARLNAAWIRPPSLAGRDLHADVSFRLGRDGTLSGARIVRSSGNALFDDSILQVFRTVRRVQRPPAQAVRTYEITFRNRVSP